MPNLSCKRRHVNGKTATPIQHLGHTASAFSVSLQSLCESALAVPAGTMRNWRSQIVPAPVERVPEPPTDHAPAQGEMPRMSWVRLLKRVFDIDIEHCPNCGGALKIIAATEEPRSSSRSLAIWACHPMSRRGIVSGIAHPLSAICDLSRSVPNNLRAETGCQRNPSPPLALTSSAQRHKGPFARILTALCPPLRYNRGFPSSRKGSDVSRGPAI